MTMPSGGMLVMRHHWCVAARTSIREWKSVAWTTGNKSQAPQLEKDRRFPETYSAVLQTVASAGAVVDAHGRDPRCDTWSSDATDPTWVQLCFPGLQGH